MTNLSNVPGEGISKAGFKHQIAIESIISRDSVMQACITESGWLAFPLFEGIQGLSKEELEWHAKNSFEYEGIFGGKILDLRLGQSHMHTRNTLYVYIKVDNADDIIDELPTFNWYVKVIAAGKFEDTRKQKVSQTESGTVMSFVNRPYLITDLNSKLKLSFELAKNEIPTLS